MTLGRNWNPIGNAGRITIEDKSSNSEAGSSFQLISLLSPPPCKLDLASHDLGRRLPRIGFQRISAKLFQPANLKAVASVQQVNNLSVSAGCLQDDVYTFLDLLLKLGRLGMGLCL